MSDIGPALVYALCGVASVLCAILVARRAVAAASRLLVTVALGFGALALNNLLLVADMLVLPSADLWAWRQIFAGAAILIFLYGFIWESER